MNRRLHTLEAVATELGLGDVLDAPVRWLADQLRAKRIPGHKVGGRWMMSDSDIDATLTILHRTPAPSPAAKASADTARRLSFTATTARRTA
jgi:hypothetical protein